MQRVFLLGGRSQALSANVVGAGIETAQASRPKSAAGLVTLFGFQKRTFDHGADLIFVQPLWPAD